MPENNQPAQSAAAPAQIPPTTASFVFVDRLKRPIQGLEVKITSETTVYTGTTDERGLGANISGEIKNKDLKIFIKKKSGQYAPYGKVKPTHDVNSYTLKSPELHFQSQTALMPKEEIEQDIQIPTIAQNEVLTINRLTGELAPFIGSEEVITEVGQLVKDFPKRKSTETTDPTTHRRTRITTIEHHFKVFKTDRPRTIILNLLGSRLNYPTSTTISDIQYESMARDLGCEVAAIRAVAETETGGVAFFENGLPKILFERHKFYLFTKPERGPHPFVQFSDICFPSAGGYGSSGIYQYERLIKAARLNKEAAIKACSWGAFQVLAEYYPQCGYPSSEAMADDCMRTADAHAKLFVAFLKAEKRRAVKALQDKDWTKFTTYYNGENWREQNPTYPSKMAENYEKYKS